MEHAHHQHQHDDHRHHHHHAAGAATSGLSGERRVFWALLITGGFMLAEVAGSIISSSLTLLADAGHMLTDTAALGLSWYAFRVSRRPSTPKHSYGQHRFQVLAALVNGAALGAISIWIAIEAARRLMEPVPVLGGPMLIVAVLGLLANLAAFSILHGGDRNNLNIRGALLHVLGDLLGSAAAIVAAIVILVSGWMPIDPILSVLVALLILRSAWSLIVESWHVLMEGAPDGVDVGQLRQDLTETVPGVLDIHHVHLWSLTPERALITLHARIAEGVDYDLTLSRLQAALAERYQLTHATIQLERAGCGSH